MNNSIIVKKIVVIKTKYTQDKIMLYIDRPSDLPESEMSVATIRTRNGNGEKYCNENFKEVPLEVIEYNDY